MKLDGEWFPVEAHLNGDNLPEELLKTFQLTINDTRYSVKTGNEIDTGLIQYHQFTVPMGIDLIGKEGSNKERTIKAIYKQSGGFLFICFNLHGEERPLKFSSTPIDKYYLVRYRRVSL